MQTTVLTEGLPETYRPAILTSVVCKVIEFIIRDEIVVFASIRWTDGRTLVALLAISSNK